MATSAARAAALALALAAAACIRTDGGVAPLPIPAPPAGGEPAIRIGLLTGGARITLGGGGALRLVEPDGALRARLDSAATATAVPGTGGIAVMPAAGPRVAAEQLVVLPERAGGLVRVNGRDYRGDLVLLRDRDGLTVVNRTGLEAYLAGVVNAEMGQRAPADTEALRAQAIVSRTYAIRNLGRWEADGFDLRATVSDQAYGGVGTETPLGLDAVAATRGMVLTFQGELVDAFFFSTCAGRTVRGSEVFRWAERPYLRSIADVDAAGEAYCRLSPRYRWREEWSGPALVAALRKTLPNLAGIAPAAVDEVRDIRTDAPTPSGRVGALVVTFRHRVVRVEGAPQVRQALRPASGDLLRSAAFDLAAERRQGRVERLVAEGRGAGHGVGFCQWGAVGRARAGQRYQEILAAYYAGTAITRRY